MLKVPKTTSKVFKSLQKKTVNQVPQTCVTRIGGVSLNSSPNKGFSTAPATATPKPNDRHAKATPMTKSMEASSPMPLPVELNEGPLDSFWMPFTQNRDYKTDPHRKMLASAKGIYYTTVDNKQIIDGMSGIWCVNAGHGHPKILDAVKQQVDKMAFAPCFNTGHELPFKFANDLLGLLPNRGFKQVFFTMCGSTSVDTAMKLAIAYHKARGESSRTRFIGRERGYHGVGFGGISVGGIVANRKAFSGAMLPHIDHLPPTHSASTYEHQKFSRKQPSYGAHLADHLEEICALHDPSSIAAVVVEPVAGSTGVLPPPVGYLEKIRAICDKHGILLIFDEVICGFGRTGAAFGCEKYNVTPDMLTVAKGLTNAVVPGGAVICQGKLYKGITEGQDKGAIELFHGYTYSGHPLTMAAGIATLDVYKEEKIFENCANLEQFYEDLLHDNLKDLPNVIDIRNTGLMAGIEVSPMPGTLVTARAADIFNRCYNKGLLVRATGSTIALAPPLISTKEELTKMVEIIGESIEESNRLMSKPSY